MLGLCTRSIEGSWESRFRKEFAAGRFTRAWRWRESVFMKYILSARLTWLCCGGSLAG